MHVQKQEKYGTSRMSDIGDVRLEDDLRFPRAHPSQKVPVHLIPKSNCKLISCTAKLNRMTSSVKNFRHLCDCCHELHLQMTTLTLGSKVFINQKKKQKTGMQNRFKGDVNGL